MGTVYLGCDERRLGMHRFVAIKKLRSDVERARDLANMFEDEAQIAARIRHPNVCSVVDFDVRGETPYLVMEFLAGEPLSALLHAMSSRQALCSEERRAVLVARTIAEVCEGLHAAHELRDHDGRRLGVVHRDVSLDNLMLTYQGVPKLYDFGVVRAERRSFRTGTGLLKGKFAYIAPEVLTGSVPNRQTDVWGLGVVLWELLTLRRLFRQRSDLATLRAVTKAPIPAPSKVRPGLPPELDAIVLSALSRDPRRRLKDARELGRALNAFVASRSEPAGTADLAEWMAKLFPKGMRRAERMLERAHAAVTLPPPAPPPPVERISEPPTRIALPAKPKRAVKRRRRGIETLLVGACLALGALAVLITRDSPPSSTSKQLSTGAYVVEIAPDGRLLIQPQVPANLEGSL